MKRIFVACTFGALLVLTATPMGALSRGVQNFGFSIDGWGIGDTISEALGKAELNAGEKCTTTQCSAKSPSGDDYSGATKTVRPGTGNGGSGACGYIHDDQGIVVGYGCEGVGKIAETTPDGRWMGFVSGICSCQWAGEEDGIPYRNGTPVPLTFGQKIQKFIGGLFSRPTKPVPPGGKS